MSKKKKKNNANEQKKDAAAYYQLHSDAVDRLVNASASDDTDVEVGAEAPKRDPYKIGFLSRVPGWIKALFIKFWFNGAVCFFFYWGLGIYLTHVWDLVLVMGVAMGIVTDVLVNNLFRFMNSEEKEYDKWMLFPWKKYWTFFANIVYAFGVLFAVIYTYEGINQAINSAQGNPAETVPLGVEPFLFGVFYLVYDLAVIWLKNLIVWLAKRCRKERTKVVLQEENPTEKIAEKSDAAVDSSKQK